MIRSPPPKVCSSGLLLPVCWSMRTDRPSRRASRYMEALPTPILARSSGFGSSTAKRTVQDPSAPLRSALTCRLYRSVGVPLPVAAAVLPNTSAVSVFGEIRPVPPDETVIMPLSSVPRSVSTSVGVLVGSPSASVALLIVSALPTSVCDSAVPMPLTTMATVQPACRAAKVSVPRSADVLASVVPALLAPVPLATAVASAASAAMPAQ